MRDEPRAPGPARVRHLASRLGLALLSLSIMGLGAVPLLKGNLIDTSPETWQVDLSVYREAGRAVLYGLPLYDLRTDPPQFLPFTYPPAAALFSLPLTIFPLLVLGWLWTFLQLALLWFIVGHAFGPFLSRFGSLRWLVHAFVATATVWLLPVSQGLQYGQVNAIIVALCLVDVLAGRRTGRPGGTLVGIAAALKLTPAVFWIYWAATGQWKTLQRSVAATVTVSLAAFLVMPGNSVDYWSSALFDTSRVGLVGSVSNQSVHGLVSRLRLPDGSWPTVAWLSCCLLILVLAFTLARRLELLGEDVGFVATVGTVAFLVSPISWVHHMFWAVLLVGGLLGDGRRPGRIVSALVMFGLFLCNFPWWGADIVNGHGPWPRWLGFLFENGLPIVAATGLAALAVVVAGRSGSVTASGAFPTKAKTALLPFP